MSMLLSSSTGQTLLRDDFKFKSNNWYWRADGNQSIPTVQNGLLHLQLLNAIDSQYCNTEIYNPTEPYTPGTQVRIRLKCSYQHIGSRGWGFWDGHIDINSMLYDFDVAWMMEQKSHLPNMEYNWFHFGIGGDSIQNRQTIDLFGAVDETEWNTFHIIWRSDSTFLYVNDSQLYVATENLPDENMRVDLWIDNNVINNYDPTLSWYNNSSGSEMFVDFIEVFGMEGTAIERNISGSIIFWDSPNTYPNGKNEILWKDYNFNTKSNGEALIFLTGDAESYGTLENDDDLKIELDNTNYGWNTINSLNGSQLNGEGTSVSIKKDLNKGDHTLKIYSDNTPFLRDAIVLFNENGKVVINNSYDEIADDSDSLYDSITFYSDKSNNTIFLLSGTGYSGDKIRIEIDDSNYSYVGDNSIDGNILLGTPKTIVISENLSVGNHTIKIYKTGSPSIYKLASYSAPLTEINIKVFLEGSYIGSDEMHSDITLTNNIPNTQPYNELPWNYNGSEEINILPDNIVDWVLIEMRDNISAPLRKYYQAALLRNDGIVVNPQGESIKFLGLSSGNYYLTVYHRNHLSIISEQTVFIE